MLNYEYPPLGGGAAPVTQALVANLAQAGHVVDVVTMGFRGLPRREFHTNLNIYRVPCLRRSAVRAITVEMASYLPPALLWSLLLHQRSRYDLIHAHFIIPTGIAAVPLSRMLGLPLVITIHGSDIPDYNPDRWKRGHKVLSPLWQRIVCNTDTIISPSGYLRDLLLSHSRCAVAVDTIHHAFTPPPIYNTLPRRKRILTVSRLFPRKGIQFMLDALAGLDLEGWEIIVAGDGPMLPELQAQARRLGLPVEFTGFLPWEELQHYYATSEIFVFPSLRESFGMVLLEAMAAGCAIIATNDTGIAEVVGESGILVPPGDVGAIRAALARLIAEPDVRAHLRRQSLQHIDDFSWDAILARHLSVYRRVTAQATPTATHS
jgi:glycosyltransferase involved in cell wall biosynthesis